MCCAGSRLLVQESVQERFLKKLKARMDNLRLGSPLDKSMDIGALVDPIQRQRIAGLVDSARAEGCEVYQPAGCELPATGSWFPPTLITGAESSLHEVFGPVATVHPYASLDEAVALANGTPYGLEAYVVGTDTDAAMGLARQVRAGGVKVNGVSPLSLNLMAPRPAWGLSGLGAEGTVETITFFTGEQVVGVEGSLG